MKAMKVNLEGKTVRSYEIHIGTEILDRMGMIIAMNRWAERYVLVTDENVGALHGERVQAALEKAGLQVDRIAVAPGEASKGVPTLLTLTDRLTALGADRQTALIALGGGVVGDLTGFAASIYLRGIPVIQLPTTLLAQVDSSIGGKTGVDTAAGKNLLGTFNQPKGVFIDIAFLRTLPDEMFRSGLAEVIKYGIIESPGLLDDLEGAVASGGLRETAFLERIIATACRIKKEIVELDEQDRGLRRILNFGHTVGHAVEAASGYALSHGESVAIGMVAAARLSERLHGLPAGDAARITALIRSVGLPDRIPAEMDLEDIISRLSLDKKKEGGTIHFVMIRKLGTPFVNGGIPEEILRDALKGLKP
ncbi:MAG: 3-dehydroquinate synthase [Deltaproteobacteria bacterium]|nr:3-dehydroquinate synthase [Deltaproteobacteria bacterium]